MKHLLTTILALLLTIGIAAQSDSKSRLILEKVSNNVKVAAVEADFVFSVVNKNMEVDAANDGYIKMKGEKYVVTIPKLGIKAFSDGTTVWSYMSNGNQVTISNVEDQENDWMNPSALFTIYNKGYQSKYVGEKLIKGVKYHNIELYPEEKASDFSKIELLIDKSKLLLETAKLHAADGGIYKIKIKKINTNSAINNSEFVFNASQYPDVEIIDFR